MATAAQSGRCAICNKISKLHIDHNHRTNLVRGLLCHNCNIGIGHFYDDTEIILAAVAYLKKEGD